MRSKYAATFVLAALITPSGLRGQQTDSAKRDVSAILAQWTQAVGGAKQMAKIKTIYRTATSDEDGLKGTREEWMGAKGELKEKVDHGEDQSVSIFDGRRGWLRDWNGKLQELVAYDLGVQQDVGILDGFAALEGKAGMAEYAGEGMDGKAELVRFHPSAGLELTYYIDKSTHLPVQAEWPSFDGPMTTKFSDWREVEGVEVPFAETTSDGINTTEIHLQKVSFDAERAKFTPPAAGPDDTFFDTKAPVTVPFNFENHHIMIETAVNGEPPMWFLLDTGSNYSIISEPEVEHYHLKSYGGLKTEGGANTTTGSYVEGVTYRVGGAEVRNQHAAVLSLAGLGKVLGMKMGGMLGYDFISRFVIAVDYRKHTLTLYPASYQYHGKGTAVAFFMQQQQPYMDESIMVKEKKIPARFILDFGAADTLTLTTPFVKANNLVELAGEQQHATRRLAGSEKEFFGGTTLRGLVDEFQIGPFTLHHLPVNLSLGTHGAYASPFFSGNIGETILERFDRAWLDYPRNRLILEPGAKLEEPFPEHKSFGLTLLSDGPELKIFRVTAVAANSPAEKSGFEKGDVIAAVDSTAAEAMTLGSLRELLARDGEHHVITVKRKEEEIKLPVTVETAPISSVQ